MTLDTLLQNSKVRDAITYCVADGNSSPALGTTREMYEASKRRMVEAILHALSEQGETETVNVAAQRLYEAIGYGEKVHSKPALVDALYSILPLLTSPLLARVAMLEAEVDASKKATGTAYGTSWLAEINEIEAVLRKVCTASDADSEGGEEYFEYLVETEKGDPVLAAHSRAGAVKQLIDLWDKAEHRLSLVEGERDRLKEALTKYGMHTLDCPMLVLVSDCTCGLSTLLGETGK